MAPSTSSRTDLPTLPITSSATLKRIREMDVTGRDVFVASYPKSGTTWMQNVVYQLASGGRENEAHISKFAPFLEADRSWQDAVAELADDVQEHQSRLGWRIFNTHLLHSMLPPGQSARLIYVCREPKDVVTSEWHHFSHMAPEDGGFTGDLEAFVRTWLAGELPYGAWEPHVSAWLECAAADPRVLLVRYEHMVAEPLATLRRIAQHLALPISEAELRERVLPRVSFEYMKAHASAFTPVSVRWLDKGTGFEFIRKGRVGDSAELLSDEHRDAVERSCGEVHARVCAWADGQQESLSAH